MRALPETGGMVGLPIGDGIVLEFEPITRSALLDAIGFRALGLPMLADDEWPWSTEAIVAAYNATMSTTDVLAAVVNRQGSSGVL